MTPSNGDIFRVTGPLCWEFTGSRWILRTKASDAELWCLHDLRPNKRLSKQWRGWWFETLSCSLWRHRNEMHFLFWVHCQYKDPPIRYMISIFNNQTVLRPYLFTMGIPILVSWHLFIETTLGLVIFICMSASYVPCSAFHWYGLTSIRAWISNHITNKVWGGSTYPFPNFVGATVKVWAWISNFITLFIMDVIIYHTGIKVNPC